MRLRHIKGAEESVAKSAYIAHSPEKNKGKWARGFFGNCNPVHLEIGMGKGQFLLDLARKNPEINYLGIERYDTVILKALRKRERAEEAGMEFPNLYYLDIDARQLGECFSEGEIQKIYLNFSDPWPKISQANRRLTSPVHLRIYREILLPGGILQCKTDNEALFHYSLGSLQSSGWQLRLSSTDLHGDPVLSQGNSMTEYEEKFSRQGHPIYYLEASP